jgi:hypothetical protein
MSASTHQSAKALRRSAFSASKPMLVQTSVVTRCAPRQASIGSANCSKWSVPIQAGAFGLDLVAGRGGNVHVEVEHLGRLQPGVADVVRVADPGDRLARIDPRCSM